MRMGIGLVRLAVGGPTGVADADDARERLGAQLGFEIAQLALGAPPRQPPRLQGGDTGGVIAAIFETLERVHQLLRHWLASENADDTAHLAKPSPTQRRSWPGHPCRRHESWQGNHDPCQLVTIKANATDASATNHSAAGVFFLPAALRLRRRAARFSLITCRLRPIASASGGTSWVITEPVAT